MPGQRRVVVVVLAAGHGRRLGPAGGPGPKWLVEVGGEPIAERQLRGVELALGADAEVLAVVGHEAGRVAAFCEGRAGAAVQLLPNERHATANNWRSLQVALEALDGRLGDDDVVAVVNSDLCAAPAWFAEVLGAVGDLPAAHPGALAVDVERPLTDEAMKVAAGPADADGTRWCTGIGKVGVADPVGEYVGVTALGPEGRALVLDELRRFDGDEARVDAWYEGAFQEVGLRRPFLAVQPTPSSAWVEVDDPTDLAAAARLPG